MSRLIDLNGKRFGRLIVIKYVGKYKYLCRCDCKDKNETIVRGSDLRSGKTRSCCCLRREKTTQRSTKHGHKKNGKITGFYRSWVDMIQRCTNPNHKQWKDYGGRGIMVCEEWMEFPNFLRDNPGWKPGLTLERTDKNGNYCLDNCEWATRKQQARNTRRNLYIPHKGKNLLLIELCEKHNMLYRLVYVRIYKLGWSSEKALTTPVKKYKKRKNGS